MLSDDLQNYEQESDYSISLITADITQKDDMNYSIQFNIVDDDIYDYPGGEFKGDPNDLVILKAILLEDKVNLDSYESFSKNIIRAECDTDTDIVKEAMVDYSSNSTRFSYIEEIGLNRVPSDFLSSCAIYTSGRCNIVFVLLIVTKEKDIESDKPLRKLYDLLASFE